MEIQRKELRDGSRSLQVDVNGNPFHCTICGNNMFTERSALLNGRGSEFLSLAWADAKAINFVCTKCGYIHWFMQ